mmetsp:Transcript_27242/g.71436  ORF Transcript_27242/g.71436 Transcript_27242/m.71436 type:complete len:344 (+) Transcript_27242:162-1193(+)
MTPTFKAPRDVAGRVSGGSPGTGTAEIESLFRAAFRASCNPSPLASAAPDHERLIDAAGRSSKQYMERICRDRPPRPGGMPTTASFRMAAPLQATPTTTAVATRRCAGPASPPMWVAAAPPRWMAASANGRPRGVHLDRAAGSVIVRRCREYADEDGLAELAGSMQLDDADQGHFPRAMPVAPPRRRTVARLPPSLGHGSPGDEWLAEGLDDDASLGSLAQLAESLKLPLEPFAADLATPKACVDLQTEHMSTPSPTAASSPLASWEGGLSRPLREHDGCTTPTPGQCVTVHGWSVSTKATLVTSPIRASQQTTNPLPNITNSRLFQRRHRRHAGRVDRTATE